MVLVDLELADLSTDGTHSPVHFFDPSVNAWVKMKLRSVIQLTRPSEKLFFKSTGVTSYPSFDRHFDGGMVSKTSNVRTMLTRERAHIKHTNITLQVVSQPKRKPSQAIRSAPQPDIEWEEINITISSDEDEEVLSPTPAPSQQRKRPPSSDLSPSHAHKVQCAADGPSDCDSPSNGMYLYLFSPLCTNPN